MAYKNIKITKGNAGFGGPLIIEPNEHKNKILCVTGQQVSPVAKKIAEMTAVGKAAFLGDRPDLQRPLA